MDVFGELWKDHTERLKEKWNLTVSPEDIVIICGDISWGLRLSEAEADFEWIKQTSRQEESSLKAIMICGGSQLADLTDFMEARIWCLCKIIVIYD